VASAVKSRSGRLPEARPGEPGATRRLTPLIGADAAEQLDRGAIDVAAAHLDSLRTHAGLILLLLDNW